MDALTRKAADISCCGGSDKLCIDLSESCGLETSVVQIPSLRAPLRLILRCMLISEHVAKRTDQDTYEGDETARISLWFLVGELRAGDGTMKCIQDVR